jgi:NADPH2:quinone reductase
MKIVQAAKLDSIDDYKIIDVPQPAPQEHDVLIKVEACGMGYVDALVALGKYQVKPPTPFTPGQEIGGTVIAVGEKVTQLKVGDRVMANTFGGGLAECIVIPAALATCIPDAMSFAQAAGFRVNYVTALHGLADRARLRAGERLLVFGAAGGVGAAAVQIGRLLGAEVIAVGSTEEKRAFAMARARRRRWTRKPKDGGTV